MSEETGNGSTTEPRQFRAVGCGARGAGCMTRLVGFGVALGGGNHIRAPVLFGESQAEAIGTGVLMIVIGLAAVFAGARMSRFGRRHMTRLVKDPRLLEPQSYILYLRPFDLDEKLYGIKPDPSRSPLRRLRSPLSRTFEEDIVLSLRFKIGRVVAVGRPGERLPLSGAQRFYLPHPGWKPTVHDLIRKARLVVLATGTTEGTLWELTEVVRLLPPERLLMAVFTDPTDYDLFRHEAARYATARATELSAEDATRLAAFRLPDYPPLQNPDTRTIVVGTQGFITFGPGWEPNFVRLDPTAVWALTRLGRLRKIMRKQANPLLRDVKRRISQTPGVVDDSVIAPRAPSRRESHDTNTTTNRPE